MSQNVITPFFRVSFPNVLKPKRNELNGKDEYSLVALFPFGKDSKELDALKKAAEQAMKDKWGDKRPANVRSPFRDQGERAKDGKLPDGYKDGHVFISFKSTQRPGLVDSQNQEIIDGADFYAGCWARASVRAFAYDNKGNRGVSFGLQNVQKVKEGDPISGRARAQDEFAPVDTESSGGIFD